MNAKDNLEIERVILRILSVLDDFCQRTTRIDMNNDFTIAILDRVLDCGLCVIFSEARICEYFL